MLTVGSLCTGYGGIEFGLRAAGWPVELTWVADNDPAAARVLAHRHPDVPNHGDITTVDWATVQPVDILTAGFPCVDISNAGRQAGMGADTRSGVWTHVVQAIAVLRPHLVVIENVAALLSTYANRSTDAADGNVEPGPAGVGDRAGRPVLRALGAVLGDLATLGVDAEWVSVPASGVGACHRRNRVFVLAWPTDAESIGHGHPWQEGGQRLPAAPVGGAVRPAGRVDLLPTPTTRDGMSGPGHALTAEGTPNLRTAITLLPTPRARDHKGRDPNPRGVDLNEALALLPTPRATDGSNGGPNQRGSSGDLMLPSAVMLLPTPTAVHWARNATADRTAVKATTNDNGWTLSDVAHADRWGQYAPAIARWEQILGRPAPDPTEPGKHGRPRLAARFVEWMQGLGDGWVTAVSGLTRNQMLRLLGNGVIPQQCAAAVTHLAATIAGTPTGQPT